MKETLKAFVLLDRAGLITNLEKAAHVLGIWDLVSKNSNDRLWEMAHVPDVPLEGTSMVGSVDATEILTDAVDGPKSGVKPHVVSIGEKAHRAEKKTKV